MAMDSLFCADVPLSNCSLTHSLTCSHFVVGDACIWDWM